MTIVTLFTHVRSIPTKLQHITIVTSHKTIITYHEAQYEFI